MRLVHTATRLRVFLPGQCLRTTFEGPTRDQIFRLRRPVKGQGHKHGGQWWTTWLMGDRKHESIIQIDDCPRVKRSDLRRSRLR